MNSKDKDWPVLLERAISIAVNAHQGQRQKDGAPYILHPLHLMQQLEQPDAKMAAILHDVVEDTDVTFADLESAGMPETVLAALRLLTHDAETPYLDYIKQIAGNPLARQVKMADLTHNMDVRRLPEITDKDRERLLKYHQAWQMLSEAT